jgi:hypothetical protein
MRRKTLCLRSAVGGGIGYEPKWHGMTMIQNEYGEESDGTRWAPLQLLDSNDDEWLEA